MDEYNENNTQKQEDELFDENGRMKVDPSQKTTPTYKAKRITLAVSALLIAIILFLAFKNSNNNKPIDVIPTPTNTSEKTPEPVTKDPVISPDELSRFKELVEAVKNNDGNFVSRDSLLFDINSNSFVSLDNDIIYVYSADVLKNDDKKDKLSLYYVLDDENYFLIDENENSIKLTTDEYNSLINLYINDEASIVYPKRDDPDFHELVFMSYIKMIEDESIDVDNLNTRYLAISGDYAVLIGSPKGIDDDLHGYIFEKQNGLFEMIVAEYQDINNYQSFVNTNYGYMDIDLLLNRDINKYPKDSYNTDLDDLVTAMINANMLPEGDFRTYGVGVLNCIYMEFASGLAYVGIIEDSGIITTYPIVNADELKIILEKFNDDPPYIILKQY